VGVTNQPTDRFTNRPQTRDEAGAPGAPSEEMTRWVVGRTEEEARAAAAKKYPGREFTLTQDDDVLDTWWV
jgi:valyl-tRNA synthetase